MCICILGKPLCGYFTTYLQQNRTNFRGFIQNVIYLCDVFIIMTIHIMANAWANEVRFWIIAVFDIFQVLFMKTIFCERFVWWIFSIGWYMYTFSWHHNEIIQSDFYANFYDNAHYLPKNTVCCRETENTIYFLGLTVSNKMLKFRDWLKSFWIVWDTNISTNEKWF